MFPPSVMAAAEFVSKTSAAGIVNVMLGFVPDFAILISNHGGTNPNVYLWVNGGTGKTLGANVPAALSWLITGSTGVITRDTTGISPYAGGDLVSSAETADTAGKHVTPDGTPAAAGVITTAGLAIPADHQTADGRNVLIAFRANR